MAAPPPAANGHPPAMADFDDTASVTSGPGWGRGYAPSVSSDYFSLYSAGEPPSLEWDAAYDPRKTVVLQPTRTWKKPRGLGGGVLGRLPFLGPKGAPPAPPPSPAASPPLPPPGAGQPGARSARGARRRPPAGAPAPPRTIHIAQQNEAGFYTISEISVEQFNELYGDFFGTDAVSLLERRGSLASSARDPDAFSLADTPSSPRLGPHALAAQQSAATLSPRTPSLADGASVATAVPDDRPRSEAPPALPPGSGSPRMPAYTDLDLEIQQLLAADPAAPQLDLPPILEDVPPPLTASPPAAGDLISPEALAGMDIASFEIRGTESGADGGNKRASVLLLLSRGEAARHRPPRDPQPHPQPPIPEPPAPVLDADFQSELARITKVPSGLVRLDSPPAPPAPAPPSQPPASQPAQQPAGTGLPTPRPSPPTPPTARDLGPPVIPPTSTEIASTFRPRDSMAIFPASEPGERPRDSLFDWEELMAEARMRVEREA